MMNWPTIIETNSYDEGNTYSLSYQLRQQKELARYAMQSCEHYKKINESLLSAMTQMTQERKNNKIDKEREKEQEKREKLAEYAIRQANIKLYAATSKALLLEKAKEYLQNTLYQLIRENAAKNQTVNNLLLEVYSLRVELAKQQNDTKVVQVYQISQDLCLVDQLQQLKQRYEDMEMELRSSFNQLLYYKTYFYQNYKAHLQSRLNNLQFELTLIRNDCEQLKKENTNMKKMLAESTIKNFESMEQHHKDFYNVHKKSSQNFEKISEKLKLKDNYINKLIKGLRNEKSITEKIKTERDELKNKVMELEKLLKYAKFHIVSIDLENKNMKKVSRKSRIKMENSIDLRNSENDQNLTNLLLSLYSRSSYISTDCMSRHGSRKDFTIDKPILKTPNTMR